MWVYYRMPDLVYIPFSWGERDKANWLAMDHEGVCSLLEVKLPSDCINGFISILDRQLLLNARSEIIMRKEVVMPIDLTYDPIKYVKCYPAACLILYKIRLRNPFDLTAILTNNLVARRY